MTEYRLCMLRQEDGLSKKDRHDMSLLSHSQGGAHQALVEMRGSPSRALGVIIMKGTESTDRTQTPAAHTRIHTHIHHKRMPECPWAHAHKGRPIHDYWQLSLSPTSGGRGVFIKRGSMRWKLSPFPRFRSCCSDQFQVDSGMNALRLI